MNILLTGGAGYIGSHTSVVLSQAGHEVVILDNFCNSSLAVLERLQHILGKAIPFIEADVLDTDVVQNVLRKYEIEAVIHFAGVKAVGESVEKPIKYYANNVQGTISLLHAMKAINLKTLVFSSSATVYGDPLYLPIDESHPTSVTNAYGRSKLHIENILKDVAKSDPEWKIICLRYFNPVGAHESGLIGENPNGLPNNLMPYIAQVAAGELTSLSVFGDNYSTSDGTGVRDYIHIMDLAEGHLAALNFLPKTVGLETFNLGTGNGYSVLQMINAYEKVCGKFIPYKVVGKRSGDIASCYATPNKANKILHWKAGRTLNEMCASSWAFQEQLIRSKNN